MRIFQVLAGTAHRSIPGNQTWYRNFHLSLKSMGHDVDYFPLNIKLLQNNKSRLKARAEFSQKMVENFRAQHLKKPYDLFFAYLRDDLVDGLAIEEISRTGVPTCNFSCNNTHQFHLVKGISPYFDINLHAERDVGYKFHQIGANPIWWPMASNPDFFKPLDVPRSIDVSFVGESYGLRSLYITHLLENGIDVHAFGPLWGKLSQAPWKELIKGYLLQIQSIMSPSKLTRSRKKALLEDHLVRRRLKANFPGNVHQPVSDQKLISLYSESQISLGFVDVFTWSGPKREIRQHLHLREFEAPMAGALYCTGYLDELEEFFEPGKEIVVYDDEHELLDKISYYLRNPDQAEVIRQAGHQRALRDHTYQQRFQSLFDQLGLGDT
jgi:spore maturation protein CgeB